MTLGQLLANATSSELALQTAYDLLEAEQHKDDAIKARAEAALR